MKTLILYIILLIPFVSNGEISSPVTQLETNIFSDDTKVVFECKKSEQQVRADTKNPNATEQTVLTLIERRGAIYLQGADPVDAFKRLKCTPFFQNSLNCSYTGENIAGDNLDIEIYGVDTNDYNVMVTRETYGPKNPFLPAEQLESEFKTGDLTNWESKSKSELSVEVTCSGDAERLFELSKTSDKK